MRRRKEVAIIISRERDGSWVVYDVNAPDADVDDVSWHSSLKGALHFAKELYLASIKAGYATTIECDADDADIPAWLRPIIGV